MKYFARFNENGERIETHAADGMPYSYTELKNMAEFVELSEEEYQMYCAGCVRDAETGKPTELPSITNFKELQKAKLAEIDEMTRQRITGGFTSAAKRTAHIYDSAEVDQLTFSAMYAASKSPDFETTAPYLGKIPIRAVPEGESEKIIVLHNAVEMQKVIDDLALHIGTCKQIGWQLQEQAKAAKNQSDLEKIIWIS